METYPTNINDSIIESLSKGVLNLGNECRALAEENKRLKAEVERLTKAGDDLAWDYAQHLSHEMGYGNDEDAKEFRHCPYGEPFVAWDAAKEGKQ